MADALEKIEVVVGDITRMPIDAIVNAANSSLMGGGGVDGAIHRAGGPAILEACREIRRTTHPDGLPTGQAIATPAGKLPARWVIHTVGPVYSQEKDPAAKLAACYRNCLAVASERDCAEIAFPAISTGVYGYPKREAAQVAAAALDNALQRPENARIQRVVLAAFSPEDAAILQEVLEADRARTGRE